MCEVHALCTGYMLRFMDKHLAAGNPPTSDLLSSTMMLVIMGIRTISIDLHESSIFLIYQDYQPGKRPFCRVLSRVSLGLFPLDVALVIPQFHYQQDVRARKIVLSVTIVLRIFRNVSLDIAKVLLYELLDPQTKVQRVRSFGLQIWHNLLFVDFVVFVSLELSTSGTALKYFAGGCKYIYCDSWIRWLVSRIRSCADKLGGGWESDEVQRSANRYDDDGHGVYIRLRLLLLAVVIMEARALLP